MVGEKQTNNMGFKMKSSIQKLCSPLQSVENPGDNKVVPDTSVKTNAVNLKDMTPEQRKAQMNEWKAKRKNNTKPKLTEKEQFWKNNPNKKHSMKYGVNPTNPNSKHLDRTAWDGTGFGEDDNISKKVFTSVASAALGGPLIENIKNKAIKKAASTLSTAKKINTGNSFFN